LGCILVGLHRVLAAVEFDRDFLPGAGEIDDVRPNRVLAAKAAPNRISRDEGHSIFSACAASRRSLRAIWVRLLNFMATSIKLLLPPEGGEGRVSTIPPA